MSLSSLVKPLLLLAATPLVACSTASAPEAQSAAQASGADWCRSTMYGEQNRSRICTVREMTASLPASGQLTFEAGPNGDVEIESWDRNEVRVRSRVVATAPTAEEAQRLVDGTEVTLDGGTLRQRSPRVSGSSASVSVSYRVFAPRRTSVDLRTTNGDVSVRDLSGAVTASTTNGDVDLYDVAAPTRVRTTNGDIVIEYASRATNRNEIDAETTNGDIDLRLPSGFGATIEAASRNGEIHARGLTVQRARHEQSRQGESVRGEIGGGGQPLRANTSNGDITIRIAR